MQPPASQRAGRYETGSEAGISVAEISWRALTVRFLVENAILGAAPENKYLRQSNAFHFK
jgi:hypothetical protein